MDRIIANNRPLEELAAKMSNFPEKYKQLQVFLHRERNENFSPEYEFLLVTPSVFGKVELKDIQVEGDYIRLEFLDCTMQELGLVQININDKKPSVLFVSWHDLRKMVFEEGSINKISNELLEFNF